MSNIYKDTAYTRKLLGGVTATTSPPTGSPFTAGATVKAFRVLPRDGGMIQGSEGYAKLEVFGTISNSSGTFTLQTFKWFNDGTTSGWVLFQSDASVGDSKVITLTGHITVPMAFNVSAINGSGAYTFTPFGVIGGNSVIETININTGDPTNFNDY